MLKETHQFLCSECGTETLVFERPCQICGSPKIITKQLAMDVFGLNYKDNFIKEVDKPVSGSVNHKMKRVINFSGGKTSALMTILLKPTNDDIVMFTDTGREHLLTYKFIDDFERHENIKVNRIAYTHRKSEGLTGFDALNNHKTTLPNRMKRLCTTHLKVDAGKKFLRPLIGMCYEQYIGFRFDEPNRVKNFKPNYKKSTAKFPLFDMGITKEMVNQYWLTKPYTLEIPSILGNCDLCFLKGKNNIIKILQLYPELADKWIKDEDDMLYKTGKKNITYFPDVTYRQLLNIAQNQKSLFDLEEALPAFNCSCTA